VQVEHQSIEPGAQFGVAAKLLSFGEQGNECLLGDVIGYGLIPGEVKGQRIDAVLVRIEQAPECVRVAGLAGQQKRGLVGRFNYHTCPSSRRQLPSELKRHPRDLRLPCPVSGHLLSRSSVFLSSIFRRGISASPSLPNVSRHASGLLRNAKQTEENKGSVL